ncbi:hypothetical protein [Hyunsoonleella pacifica]|uniref:hypothetical protein n=1 Tax=Hyunsoonleella pacifica TaxID=1080224 RepID=UPI00157FB089|nr:hypothetical protein [Hyunsoonleella pacifica]GGD07220.1 hypothetical protein GCM10011368_06370 [Hyunsoonleella pacifica]
MKRIKLTPLNYKNALQIAISFNYDDEIRSHLKKLPEVKWSQTHKTFYILFTTENKQQVYQHLRLKNWFVDYKELKVPKHIKAKSLQIKLPHFQSIKKKILLDLKNGCNKKDLVLTQ